MYGSYSLARLGEVNKRHVEEFGSAEDIEKIFGFGRKGIDRAAIAAMRARARAERGASIPHGRLDRVPPGERLRNTAKKKIEETKQQIENQVNQTRNKLTEQAEEVAQPIRQALTGAERTTENVRQTAQEARAATETATENVRRTAEQTKQTAANVNAALHTAQGTAESVGRAGRNIGFGLGAAGLGAGGAMAGYTYADSHRQGGNVERDRRGRLRLSAKGRQKVINKGSEVEKPSRQDKREAKSLAAHKKRIAGIHHNAGPQNYRPGLTFSPFTHTEVRRDSATRRMLRPTAGYLLGGFAGRGLDTALTAATRGKYHKSTSIRDTIQRIAAKTGKVQKPTKHFVPRHLQGKYGRWGGRIAGTSAGFTQNVRSGDVEPFRRSTGEQPRYKVMVPTPLALGGRGVFYAGSKPAPKE